MPSATQVPIFPEPAHMLQTTDFAKYIFHNGLPDQEVGHGGKYSDAGDLEANVAAPMGGVGGVVPNGDLSSKITAQ